MNKEQLIVQYSKTIQRLNKADEFFNSDFYTKNGQVIYYKNIEEEFAVKSKFFDEYNKIIIELSTLQALYKKETGQEMELKEMLEGFEI